MCVKLTANHCQLRLCCYLHLLVESTIEGLCVQKSSEAHSAFYPMGTGGPFCECKAWLGHDTDHSPPSSAEIKNE
jgi:hypothetical protein